MSYKQNALSLKYIYMVVHFMWGDKNQNMYHNQWSYTV